jgi:hypothetical protein
MDESLFFLNDNTTIHHHIVQTNMANQQFYNMMFSYLLGIGLGFVVSGLCVLNSNTQRKIDSLNDEIESLKEVVSDLEDTVDDLVTTNEELEEKNDKLTVDASASDRLIDRLKNEVCVLTNKVNVMDHEMAGLESDNNMYIAEISQLQNNLLRSRHNNSTASTPNVIRKRMRDEML